MLGDNKHSLVDINHQSFWICDHIKWHSSTKSGKELIC